jgi:hypothetical protein
MANGNKVLEFLRKGFPFIATGLSLAGPPGNLASTILGKALSVDNPTPQKMLDTLQTLQLTPDQQLALTNAERQYRAQMQAMGFENEKDLETIFAADRADARLMQEQTRSRLPGALAVIVTVGFFGLLVIGAFHSMPAASEKLLDVMTGSLGAAWLSIVNFYFGRSSEGDRKTELLAQAPAIGTNG